MRPQLHPADVAEGYSAVFDSVKAKWLVAEAAVGARSSACCCGASYALFSLADIISQLILCEPSKAGNECARAILAVNLLLYSTT
jgi:hypothetical protein